MSTYLSGNQNLNQKIKQKQEKIAETVYSMEPTHVRATHAGEYSCRRKQHYTLSRTMPVPLRPMIASYC